MLKAYKYQIFPTQEQQDLLTVQFGISRFVYNWVFDQKKKEYEAFKESNLQEKPKYLSPMDYNKVLTSLKKEFYWIKEGDSQVLQEEIRHLFHAYERFFKAVKERKARKQKLTNKKGRLLDFPRYKSKRDRQSISFPQRVKADLENAVLTIPKVGKVAFACSRNFVGEIRTVTISKEVTGKYFASILVKDADELPEIATPDECNATGIDVGLSHFAILSNGEKIENPRHLKKCLARLKRSQRAMARKNKASKNYGKAKLKRALLEERIANQRKDFLHKATHRIVYEKQATTICVENLSIKNMMKNHCLARSIADASWGEFFRQLKYKCAWHGKNLLEIGRFEPSSKTCSECGYLVAEMPLKVRTWVCPCCASKHDRDINAAKNIVRFAFKNNIVRTGENLSLWTENLCNPSQGGL